MIETPSGEEVYRGSDTWQYWKFVWRSSMVLKVKLVDSIWASKMGAASALAGASRETLPGDHPLRRLLSLFTYGTITENGKDFTQLISPEAMMDRVLPFANFQQVNNVSIQEIQSLKDQFGFLINETQEDDL